MNRHQPPARPRFEYGRHQTFAVRHGWLAKGLGWIKEKNGFRPDVETADALGLGTRMAKSLQFWLEASGLATRVRTPSVEGAGHRRVNDLRITEVGETIAREDPYLEYPATWWFVHLSLARREKSVWNWFFSEYPQRRFSREECVSAFRAHAAEHAANPPSVAMAQREIACLLQTYGSPKGQQVADPEDATWCPLRDLGLVAREGDMNRFEKNRPLDEVPVEAFLACASALASQSGADSVSLGSLARNRDGPGKALCLDGVRIERLLGTSARLYATKGVHVTLLGSERHLELPGLLPAAWLDEYFRRIRAIAA